MPIVVKAPEGAITPGAEDRLFYELMDAFLRTNGSSLDNAFIGPNLIGDLQIMPKGASYAAGKKDEWVAVQLRVPSFALTQSEQKAAFIAGATEAVLQATSGRIKKDRIFVNMVYGDGFWGIGGVFYTDEALAAAIAAAA